MAIWKVFRKSLSASFFFCLSTFQHLLPPSHILVCAFNITCFLFFFSLRLLCSLSPFVFTACPFLCDFSLVSPASVLTSFQKKKKLHTLPFFQLSVWVCVILDLTYRNVTHTAHKQYICIYYCYYYLFTPTENAWRCVWCDVIIKIQKKEKRRKS